MESEKLPGRQIGLFAGPPVNRLHQNGKGTAFAWFTFNLDYAVVQFHKFEAEGESEAGSRSPMVQARSCTWGRK